MNTGIGLAAAPYSTVIRGGMTQCMSGGLRHSARANFGRIERVGTRTVVGGIAVLIAWGFFELRQDDPLVASGQPLSVRS